MEAFDINVELFIIKLSWQLIDSKNLKLPIHFLNYENFTDSWEKYEFSLVNKLKNYLILILSNSWSYFWVFARKILESWRKI